MAKSVCSITREDFREKARPVSVTNGGESLPADVKEYSTGSHGWYLNTKTKELPGGPAKETAAA